MPFAGLFRRLFAPRPDRSTQGSCWVCDTPVGTRYPDDIHQSPLGGAFTHEGCDTCRQKRAVVPLHAAWFMCTWRDASEDASPPSPQAISAVDAEGSRSGRPVHVYQDGSYEPMIPWATSQSGQAAIAEFRKRSQAVAA